MSAPAATPPTPSARRRLALYDSASTVTGVVLAVVVHVGVGLFALRAGAHEGNIVRAQTEPVTEPHDEEIIEGELLRQGGGGQYDPRQQIHREVPVRSEEV